MNIPATPWTAIADIAGQVNKTAQDFLKEKIEKDAAAIATTQWADFLANTTTHLHESTQLAEVAPDPHTGNLTCLVKMEPNHPDFTYHNQPLSHYVTKSLEKRGSQMLQGVKNPLAKKFLEAKLQGHQIQVANNLAEHEARLIHDKRKIMVGDAIEKLSKSAYQSPADVGTHLADVTSVINTIADSPSERDKLSRLAREKIVEAAAIGTIHKDPAAYLNNPAWAEHLDVNAYVRLTHTAKTLAHQAQIQLQHQVSAVSRSHFDSLLHTGKGLPGFEEQVRRAYGEGSPQHQAFLAKHGLYEQASIAMQTLNKGSLSDGAALIQSLHPQGGDPEFSAKLKMAQVLEQQLSHQITQAKRDPAAFVEKIFAGEIPEQLPFLKRLGLRKTLQTQKGIPDYAQKYLMKEEREKFLASMTSDDPHQVEAAVKSLIKGQDHERPIGREILEELLEDKEKLSLLAGLYMEQALKEGDLAPTLLKMIPIQKQLFSSISSAESRELEKTVTTHPNVIAFQNAMTHGQPHHVTATNMRIQGILHLARFYQIDRGEKARDAVNHAVKDLIGNEYITPIKASATWLNPNITQADGLMVPKAILADGKKVELDEPLVNRHLLDIRKNLVEGNILSQASLFDFTATFGAVPDNPALLEEAKSHSQNLLREGRFRLAPDQRHVYYAVRNQDGSEQILLKNASEILFFDLKDSMGEIDPFSQGRERENKGRVTEWMIHTSEGFFSP